MYVSGVTKLIYKAVAMQDISIILEFIRYNIIK